MKTGNTRRWSGLTHSQFIQQCDRLSAPHSVMRWRCNRCRAAGKFVDGRFIGYSVIARKQSGFDVSVDERQTLAAPVYPECFLHLTESPAQCVTYIQVRRNQRPTKALLLMHITCGGRGWRRLNAALSPNHLALAEGAEVWLLSIMSAFTAAKTFYRRASDDERWHQCAQLRHQTGV